MKYTPLSLAIALLLTGCLSQHDGAIESNESTTPPSPTLPINHPPKAQQDSVTTPYNTNICIDVLANDYDSDGTIDKSTILLADTPTIGISRVAKQGYICYSPAQDFTGEVLWHYQVADNEGAISNTTTLQLTVLPKTKGQRAALPSSTQHPKEWFIHLIAQDKARGLKDASSQLGQTRYHSTTLKALPPRNHHLTIRLSDIYKQEFHRYQEEDSWEFTVNSDTTDATIILSWRGLYQLYPTPSGKFGTLHRLHHPLLRQMKLIDLDTGEEITAQIGKASQRYIFGMEGESVRHFKWVLEKDPIDLMKLHRKRRDKTIPIPHKPTGTPATTKVFDLSHPPTLE